MLLSRTTIAAQTLKQTEKANYRAIQDSINRIHRDTHWPCHVTLPQRIIKSPARGILKIMDRLS